MAVYLFKRKRHVCSMKGCRNKEVLLCTKNGELGGGIYLCRECIEALSENVKLFDGEKAAPAVSDASAVNKVEAEAKTETPVVAESEKAPVKSGRKKSTKE